MATMSDLRRVVMTGAAGAIGTAVAAELSAGWDLCRTDLRADPGAAHPIAALDVTDPAALRVAFAGADAVVHLAGDPRPTASWDDLHLPNVVGTVEVARAAAELGIRRLVLASSQQAVAGYPEERQVRSSDAPLPRNLYGATKAWAEAVGGWIANTTSTSVVALRIGFFGLQPPSGADDTPRNRAAWLSPGDCARLIRAAVEADVDGLTIVSGISANRYRKADLGPAEASIGYAPVDDAWSWTSASS
jgi:nucleoside-diphosphate-sugar epimerase